MHPMGSICNKLSNIIKGSTKLERQDLDYNNYNNNTINNIRKKNVPVLDISNNINNRNNRNNINLNTNNDEEPPSYREVRNEDVNFYKKTMLFNSLSDSLITRPRM